MQLRTKNQHIYIYIYVNCSLYHVYSIPIKSAAHTMHYILAKHFHPPEASLVLLPSVAPELQSHSQPSNIKFRHPWESFPQGELVVAGQTLTRMSTEVPMSRSYHGSTKEVQIHGSSKSKLCSIAVGSRLCSTTGKPEHLFMGGCFILLHIRPQ